MEILYSRLKISNGHVFLRAMCHQNVSWAIQIPRLIALEIGDVGSVVDDDGLEIWGVSVIVG